MSKEIELNSTEKRILYQALDMAEKKALRGTRNGSWHRMFNDLAESVLWPLGYHPEEWASDYIKGTFEDLRGKLGLVAFPPQGSRPLSKVRIVDLEGELS